MSLRDKLQQIYGAPPSSQSDLRRRLEKLHARHEEPLTIEQLLGGEFVENESGRVLRVERNYPDFQSRGQWRIEEAYRANGQLVSLLCGDPSLSDFDLQQALFIDTETTGLSGGAGCYPFLVGTGFFVGSDFRSVQFFLPDFESEHAFLKEIASLVTGKDGRCFRYLVSFNGKTFDLPLVGTRFILQRLDNPCAGLKHVDLLHPCRLLWKRRLSDCSLQSLERHVLGYSRVGDIASMLIPSTYFNYLNWGQFGALREVLEHNREDVLSMAVLLGRACRSLELGEEEIDATGHFDEVVNWMQEEWAFQATDNKAEDGRLVDQLSVARLFSRRGQYEQAVTVLEALVNARVSCCSITEQAFLDLIQLKRRLGEDEVALERCLQMLEQFSVPPRQVFEHAAKILEHRKRDLDEALRFVVQALELYPGCPELEHRRSRLMQKSSRRASTR